MAESIVATKFTKIILFVLLALNLVIYCKGNDILGCGGFIESHAKLDFAKIEVGLYTKSGSLIEKTECAPTNGYYFLPLYEKGDYILKVHPPAGWSFEPSEVAITVDGLADKCSTGKDVNFVFNGFGIAGKVITAGQTQGPSGVSVQLVSDHGETRQTVTASGGDFHFTPVIPGIYTLKASHPKWSLEPSQATLHVKGGNTELPTGALAVKGYDVTGTVSSYGNPVPGMYVLLYSKEERPKYRVEGCKTGLLQGVPDAPICYSITDSSGQFSFGLVPAGDYRLLALAKTPGQATVVHNVKPEGLDFSVRHNSQRIENAFEVASYTITGSVLKSRNGAPLPNARVLVDGRPSAVTDATGKYTLVALTPGEYSVSFAHEQCEVDSIRVSVPPRGAGAVPAAVVRAWRVCGAVRGGEGGPGVRTLSITPQPRSGSLRTDDNGNWCTFLEPGTYSVSVDVTDQERHDGLQYYPVSQQLTVSVGPVADVTFSQLKARVRGRVSCDPVTACEGLEVTMTSTTHEGKVSKTYVKNGEYEFLEVLPGTVTLTINSAKLCWSRDRINLLVNGAEVTADAFEHVGYRLPFHSDYDIEVAYVTDSNKSGTISLNSGSSSHCLPKASKYTLTPKGCHLFEPEKLEVDIKKDLNNVCSFKAVAHAAKVVVTSTESVDDLMLSITNNKGLSEVGPLVPKREGDGYVYEHTLYLAEGEVVWVSGQSPRLALRPARATLRGGVGGDACGGRLRLRALRGEVVAGRLEPSVPGATVTLTGEDTLLTVTTDEKGTYSFGPLDASKQYTVEASKESYVMSPPDAHGVIHARKLAEIIVRVVDDADGKSLEEALVSVSGGSFRRTAGAKEEGEVRFPALAPGEYYVKPHLRDYSFKPQHNTIKVEEGKTHEIVLRGVRTAWRVTGHVQSLAGAALPAAVTAQSVRAVHGQPDSRCPHSEAAATDSGHYTLRGLLPGCTYSIDLKHNADSNEPQLRLAHPPVVIEIKEKKDIEGIRLIALEPNSITDCNVLIYTPNIDHYKTLRLKMYQEDKPNSPLFTTKLDSSGYSAVVNPGLLYVMPRLPVDNKTYVVQLESSLSQTTHAYEESIVYFKADGAFKDFTIEFLPKVKTSDQELRQTSLLVVPLLGVIALAFLYRDRLLLELQGVLNNVSVKAQVKPTKPSRTELLDKASIEQIVSNVNAAGKRQTKKKTQLIM